MRALTRLGVVRRRGTRTLGEAAKSRDNNFDLVRLFAAGLVVFSHSFALAGRDEPWPHHTLGTAGVEIFFATSGFLVARSWFGDPSAKRFFAKRALRIMPGLIVAVLATAFVLGATFTTMSPARYLGSSIPWQYSLDNIRLHTAYVLESVFDANPISAANGSLWTLPSEVYAYGLLAQAAICGAFRSRRAVVGVYLFLVYWNVVFPPEQNTRLICIFFGAVCLYVLRDRVPLRSDIALVLAAIWVHYYTTEYATAAGIVALPYLVTFAAYRSPSRLRMLTRPGDVSYGVYIYAFPIQQSIVAMVGTIRPLALFGVAAPLVWLAGFASWRLVESPALRRKPARNSGAARPADARPVGALVGAARAPAFAAERPPSR